MGSIENPTAVGNPNETPIVRLGPEAARLMRAVLGQAPSKNNRTIPVRAPAGAAVEVLDQFTDQLGLSILDADPTSAYDDCTASLDRLAVEQLRDQLDAWLARA